MTEITETGQLKFGLKIGDECHKDFVLRPIFSMNQMFRAEDEAEADKPMQFQAALLAQQIVRTGSFDGPFTMQMLGNLHPVDFGILRGAQNQLSKRVADAGKPQGDS